jgi:hypothetical protein
MTRYRGIIIYSKPDLAIANRMVEFLDLIILFSIFLFYGIGDVATTLYGMKKYDMKEGNAVMTRLLGEQFLWHESIIIKSITLALAFFIYYFSRIVYSSTLYQVVWWILGILIVIRGIQVTIQNWYDIQAVRLNSSG